MCQTMMMKPLLGAARVTMRLNTESLIRMSLPFWPQIHLNLLMYFNIVMIWFTFLPPRHTVWQK